MSLGLWIIAHHIEHCSGEIRVEPFFMYWPAQNVTSRISSYQHAWNYRRRRKKVGLPRCLVSFIVVPFGPHCPCSKNRCICGRIVVPVPHMPPRDAEYTCFLVHPFQTGVLVTVYLPHQPVRHSLRSLVGDGATTRAVLGGGTGFERALSGGRFRHLIVSGAL